LPTRRLFSPLTGKQWEKLQITSQQKTRLRQLC
jgi:hypothetical protein